MLGVQDAEDRGVRTASVGTSCAGERVQLGGAVVDLLEEREAVSAIVEACGWSRSVPLAVASANLDHIFHFGHGGRWAGVMEQAAANGTIRWLTLLDGVPLVREAERLTSRRWPKLSGSDLTPRLLDEAEQHGIRVGFLGGSPATHERLRHVIAHRWPRLTLGGCWAPERGELTDPRRARALAEAISSASIDMLFVGLGKPRQELWIAEHGGHCGAGCMLAFGASADFVAGTVARAPDTVAEIGLEWAWRLAREPRRMARRYLAYGPGAYVTLRRQSHPERSSALLAADEL